MNDIFNQRMNTEAMNYIHYSLPKSVLRNFLRRYFPCTSLGSMLSTGELQNTINTNERYRLVMMLECCIQELHLSLLVTFNPTFAILIIGKNNSIFEK